jgi:hypothetical protein
MHLTLMHSKNIIYYSRFLPSPAGNIYNKLLMSMNLPLVERIGRYCRSCRTTAVMVNNLGKVFVDNFAGTSLIECINPFFFTQTQFHAPN